MIPFDRVAVKNWLDAEITTQLEEQTRAVFERMWNRFYSAGQRVAALQDVRIALFGDAMAVYDQPKSTIDIPIPLNVGEAGVKCPVCPDGTIRIDANTMLGTCDACEAGYIAVGIERLPQGASVIVFKPVSRADAQTVQSIRPGYNPPPAVSCKPESPPAPPGKTGVAASDAIVEMAACPSAIVGHIRCPMCAGEIPFVPSDPLPGATVYGKPFVAKVECLGCGRSFSVAKDGDHFVLFRIVHGAISACEPEEE